MTSRNDIERLFKTHYVRVYHLAAILLHDDDLARDIVHDIFTSLLDSPSNTPITPGYLLKAVRNRCLNHIRNCEIHQRIVNRYFIENEDYDTDEQQVEETIRLMHDLIISDLTPQARRVINLRFFEGLSFAQISAEMGISENAVYRHLRRALIIMRQKLNRNG